MRIFSNFDTKLREKKLKEYQDHYGLDNVLILQKSLLFFWIKVVPGILVFFIIMIATFFVSRWIFIDGESIYIFYSMLGVFFVLFVFSGRFIKHLIDYYMDFTFVTPTSLIMFNQTGMLKRDMAYVDINKIKTILIKKRNLLYGIFNNGDLIFLSEGDSEKYGEVKLYFIHSPEKKKKKIGKIIGYEI